MDLLCQGSQHRRGGHRRDRQGELSRQRAAERPPGTRVADPAGGLVEHPGAAEMIERGHHDMGGQPAGKVERTEHDYPEWERRVDAMVQLLRLGRKITVDELRKNIESLPPQAYDRLSYYEKWISSLTQTLIQRGVITSDELGRKMEQVEQRAKGRG